MEQYVHKKSGKLFDVVQLNEEQYQLTCLTGKDFEIGKTKEVKAKTFKSAYRLATASETQEDDSAKLDDQDFVYYVNESTNELVVKPNAEPIGGEWKQISKKEYNTLADELDIYGIKNPPALDGKGLFGVDMTTPVPESTVNNPNDDSNRYFHHVESNGLWYTTKEEIAKGSLVLKKNIELSTELTKEQWEEMKDAQQKTLAPPPTPQPTNIIHDSLAIPSSGFTTHNWWWDSKLGYFEKELEYVNEYHPISKVQFESGMFEPDLHPSQIDAMTGNVNYDIIKPIQSPEATETIFSASEGSNPTEAHEQQQKPTEVSEKATETQQRGSSMRENRAERSASVSKPFNPKSPYLRQSMIKTYELDPGTFYASYEEGFNEATIFTSTGTAVHGVMEDFFTLLMQGKVTPDPDHVGEALIEVEENGKAQPLNIRQFTQKYLTKWWSEYGWADEEWFSNFLEYTENYLRKSVQQGLPNVLAVEFEFKLEESVLGTPVSGTIDRIDRIDDHTIRIVDYKTNFQAFSAYDLENSSQFKMYTLAVEQLKDQLGEFDTVVCQYEMIRLGFTQRITFDREQLEAFRVYIRMLWDKMLSGSDRDFRPSQYSAFSSLRTGNPAYDDMIHNRIISQYDAEDVQSLIDELNIVNATFKTAKVRKEELETALKSHIAQAGGQLQVGDELYSVRSDAQYSFDSNRVIQQLAMTGNADLIAKMVKFSPKQLKDNLPAPMVAQLMDTANISYKRPQISKKKVKK